MHHIYHTKGIVLSSRNVGEANKSLSIYTRELGLVRAQVQGIRLQRSKLRYSLQDFSYAKIDLVRGKEVWRVTSATNETSFPYARSGKNTSLFIARLTSLISRLCIGEEANEKVFDIILQAFLIIDDSNFDDGTLDALELHTVLSVVYELGYVGESEILDEYLGKDFNEEKIATILKDRKSIISHINKALRESQL